MTTTPHGQVPDALRLAEEITNLECSSEAVAKTIAAAADELCRLHVENASLRASPKAAPGDAIDEAMRERDDAEDFIDALLDEVLGHERPEWSSSYGRADALNDVQERMAALHKPAVGKAWGQFQSAMAAPQQEAQEPATVPYQKLTNEIDQILSDPDTELSIGAKRALLWVRTWVSVPLWTTPQPAPDCHHRPPCDECAAIAAQGGKA